MESIVILSSSALCAFVMYYFVLDYSFVDLYDASYVLSFTWEFDLYQCGTAVNRRGQRGDRPHLHYYRHLRQIFARIRLSLERNSSTGGSTACDWRTGRRSSEWLAPHGGRREHGDSEGDPIWV